MSVANADVLGRPRRPVLLFDIMRPTINLAAALLGLAVLLITGCSAARPLHRSHASIRASLLKRTPPTTTKEQVEAFIVREGWRLSRDSASLLPQAVAQGGGPSVSERVQSVLMADLGGYFIFIGTREIYGLWGFDGEGRLVDVWIYKERDVL